MIILRPCSHTALCVAWRPGVDTTDVPDGGWSFTLDHVAPPIRCTRTSLLAGHYLAALTFGRDRFDHYMTASLSIATPLER